MTDWITSLVERMGYVGIALLMFLENLFPPIPSELIMPLAGFAAGKGTLGIIGVVAAGTIGSVLGGLVWYFVGRWLGEDRLKRWAERHGRWLTLSPRDIDRIDDWFDRHCNWAVLGGRMIPAVRTLVSIPAGIFEMTLGRFLLYSTFGTAAWSGVLAMLGYGLGRNYAQVQAYVGPASTTIVAAILLWYLYRVATFRRQPRRTR